jgi:ABC-type amino acid transport substrate-binding protein
MANNLSVAKGEFKLVSMLNEATQELEFDGVIDQIMKKNGLDKDSAWKPARPYAVPE